MRKCKKYKLVIPLWVMIKSNKTVHIHSSCRYIDYFLMNYLLSQMKSVVISKK